MRGSMEDFDWRMMENGTQVFVGRGCRVQVSWIEKNWELIARAMRGG
jgi:hypothetical protein